MDAGRWRASRACRDTETSGAQGSSDPVTNLGSAWASIRFIITSCAARADVFLVAYCGKSPLCTPKVVYCVYTLLTPSDKYVMGQPDIMSINCILGRTSGACKVNPPLDRTETWLGHNSGTVPVSQVQVSCVTGLRNIRACHGFTMKSTDAQQ